MNTVYMNQSQNFNGQLYTHGENPQKSGFQPDSEVTVVDPVHGEYKATFLGQNARFKNYADVMTASGEPRMVKLNLLVDASKPKEVAAIPRNVATPGGPPRNVASFQAGLARAQGAKSSTDHPRSLAASTSWADIQDGTAALAGSYSASEPGSMGRRTEPGESSDASSHSSPHERFNNQKSSKDYQMEGKTYVDENGNPLPAWLGPKDRILYGYTKMWYYNKYWGYVEPFEEGSRDVFLHGGKVVNSKKNVTKAAKKRERGMDVPDHSMWLSEYPVVSKVVRYQKVLMTDFFMNVEEKEGRRLAANTIVVVDPAWNKTRALNEVRKHKGVKIFEDKKHGIERETWQIGDQCLATYTDGEEYPATIVKIEKMDYPSSPLVYAQFRDFGNSTFETDFGSISIPSSVKRQLDTRRCNSGRALAGSREDGKGGRRKGKSATPMKRTALQERRLKRDRIISQGQVASVPAVPPQWEPADERTPSPQLSARQQMMSAVQSAATSSEATVLMSPRDDMSASARTETPTGLHINVPLNKPTQFVPQGMAPGVIPANYFNGVQGLAPIPVQNANGFIPQQSFQNMYQPAAQSKSRRQGEDTQQTGFAQGAIPLMFNPAQQTPQAEAEGLAQQTGTMNNGIGGNINMNQWQGQNPMFLPQIAVPQAQIGGQMAQITTWVVDSTGRWTCNKCSTKNTANLVNCAQCGAQREMTTIPMNQLAGTMGPTGAMFLNGAGGMQSPALQSPMGVGTPGGIPIMQPNANMFPAYINQQGMQQGYMGAVNI